MSSPRPQPAPAAPARSAQAIATDITFEGTTLTKQCHRDECTPELVVAKWLRTGVLENAARMVPRYADATVVPSYHEALELVSDAQEAFDELPSDIRRRFENDPGQYFDFVTNPENIPEMIKMGLAQDPDAPSSEVIPAPSDRQESGEAGG